MAHRHPLVAALAARRRQLGLSQAGLARRLRSTPRAVSHFESDPGGRNLRLLEEVAQALGMRLQLVEEQEES